MNTPLPVPALPVALTPGVPVTLDVTFGNVIASLTLSLTLKQNGVPVTADATTVTADSGTQV